MHATLPDDHLMRRASRGCEASFGQLVRRHQDRLFGFFRRQGLLAHDAEDCVQETLLRLLRAAPGWQRRAPLGGFLSVLARSSYRDWCRRRSARPEPSVHLTDARVASLAAAPCHAADLLDLREAVRGLTSRMRAVVDLGLREGLSYREIGAALGIPEGTVKSRMHHAVRHLRERLCRA